MSNLELGNIAFDLPKNQSNVIKVIGVGGGGSNAINHMFQQGIKGVDFYICNTDAQALQNSGVPNKIQLGLNLTEGLGAGANPDVGKQSAVESYEDLRNMLDTNTKMVFITAGMGGGTGTGAAPIIAKMSKDMDILTVGIVTMPFQFEGKMRLEQAQKGVEELRREVDSLIVINNNKLREVYGNLGFKAGFSKADEVLATAARGIAEVITHHYTQNIDLRDAKTVLSSSGTAIMGSATASGQNRAQDAIARALDSPLLNDNKITGAKNVLLLIVSGGQEITIDEIGEINDHIQVEAGHGANIIMGVGEDESLEDSIAVTIIATGFNVEQQSGLSNTEAKKVIHSLEDEQLMQAELLNKEPHLRPIKTREVVQEKVQEKPKVIKHTLGLGDDNPVQSKKEVTAQPNQVKVQQPVQQKQKTVSSQPVVNQQVRPQQVVRREEQRVVQPRPTAIQQQPNLSSFRKPKPFEGYIPTTELLKNLDIVFEEVLPYKAAAEELFEEDNFIITNIENDAPLSTNYTTTPEQIEEEEEQFTLTFDMPLQSKPKKVEQQSTKIKEAVKQVREQANINDIEVHDYTIVEPEPIIEEQFVEKQLEEKREEIRFSLEEEAEEESIKNEMDNVEKETIDEEVLFEKKVVEEQGGEGGNTGGNDFDPVNSSITDLLKQRAEERRKKMKNFNYKFNTSKVDDMEKVPAYKRQGLDLEGGGRHSDTNMSRTSLGADDNDDMQLRSNNSFLHDNVD